jgi:hypothetical protein
MDGKYQNKISGLPELKTTKYETIFKLYKNNDNFYFYNILKAINLPVNLDETKVYYQSVVAKMPWTLVSYNAYNTIDLWWLICLTNNIFNPLKFPDQGTLLKIIKPIYVTQILDEIQNALI